MPEHKCQPVTKFTILAGVVSQCPCGIVHRVEHKTVLESPVQRFDDPQLTFDQFMEDQILHALQDEEADEWAASNKQEEPDGEEF